MVDSSWPLTLALSSRRFRCAERTERGGQAGATMAAGEYERQERSATLETTTVLYDAHRGGSLLTAEYRR